jgi:hypothetical protein
LSLFRCITRQNGSLDGSTVCNGFVRVDALVWLLAVKEIRNKLDDARNTGGSTDQDDFVDIRLVDLGIAEHFFDGLERAPEEVLAKFLKPSTRQGSIKVDSFIEGVDFDGSLGSRGQCALRTLASRA